MSDSILKKSFQKKDVERIRNLVKGKSGDRVTSGVGYNKSSVEDHKEGDVWEANGKTWTIKDGIKENVTKLDKFKKAAVPLFCPSCKQVMDKQLDPFYYKSYGTCVDCRAEFETKLKLSGNWEKHTDETYNKEIDNHIEEYKNYIKNALSKSNNSFITEAGDIEKWVGGIDKERAEQSMKEVIKYLESLKKK
tara:strand:+ start:219 stop:794 length:576 start_codon:yes stop_codon:yes gene_type:complete